MNSFFSDLAPSRQCQQSQQSIPQNGDKRRTTTGCCDFLQFLAIAFSEEQYRRTGLHPVVTNASPNFSDASMGGVSFDVRKVRVVSFPHGLDDQSLGQRTFVVVKQPRLEQDRPIQSNALDEIATELQILRHTRHISDSNILELIGIVYHDANVDGEHPSIFPALVVEYAELGNLRSFLAKGFDRSVQDKFEICRDVARGLDHLHRCGIVHCDVKDTNMLVCTSKEKKFVVKVSDFGFAISLLSDSPHVVGYTPYWEAPELHEPLQRTGLCQLDIYSYGLLLYTVMKNGALFYHATETASQVSDILKMKSSNLLQATMRMNLLLHMKNERCMLFIICNILYYCLHADAGKRFRSMHDLLELLKWCDPSDLRRENHPDEQFYQLRSLKIGEYMSWYPETKNRILDSFHQHLQSYQSAMEDNLHLGDALKGLYQARFEVELDMFLEKPTGSADETFQHCTGMTLILCRSMLGLMPLELFGKASQKTLNSLIHIPSNVTPVTNSCKMIRFCQDLDPDLPQYQGVLRKLHTSVKRYIVIELEKLYKQIGDARRRGSTICNLAYCYIDGLGVQTNLSKGIQLLHEASGYGSLKAQRYLVRIHTAQGILDGLDGSTLTRWAPDTLQEGDKQGLRVLQSLDQDAFARLKKKWAINRLLGSDEVVSPEHERQPCAVTSTCESATWGASFLHFASALNMTQLARRMISLEPSSKGRVNAYGQTPLIVACQSASFEVAKLLLEHGAEVGAGDMYGFTSLHWLVSFSDIEKRKLAPLLAGKSQDLDAFGELPLGQLESPPPNLQGGPLITGTPLHWAVAYQDFVAVDILIKMGAKASARPGIERRSALEMACTHHAAEIVHRMLQEPSVKATADQYKPLGDGQLQINLMFWVVTGNSRFDSFIRLGMAFEKKIEETMRHLVEAGVAVNSVLQRFASDPQKMSAPFAVSYHQCHAEIMRAGLKNGFGKYLDTTFGTASSGGPAMSLAVAARDRDMLATLLDAGASVTWKNIYKLSALGLVASETDDVWFALKLLEKGVPVEDPEDSLSPFFAATYKGNLKVAKLLWDRGARRDSRNEAGLTILGYLIQARTRNAVRCIRFILSLADRDESNGFEVLHHDVTQHRSSALHVALNPENTSDVMSEDPEIIETSRLVVSLLLQKYSAQEHINSKIGPHHDVPLGAAVEVGNHHVVRLLLEGGADPNAEDEFARRPLDKLFWRYCYPATLDYLKSVSPDDRNELAERLTYVNQNTSEILSLLTSYSAQASVFRFPLWHQSDQGYRNVDWVIARLKEKRDEPPAIESEVPVWGNLPIRIPENPMQFEQRRRLAEHNARHQEGANSPKSVM